MHGPTRDARRRSLRRDRKVGVHHSAEEEFPLDFNILSKDCALLHAHPTVDFQGCLVEGGGIGEVLQVHWAINRHILVHRECGVYLGLFQILKSVQADEFCPVKGSNLQGLKPLLGHDNLPFRGLLPSESNGLLRFDPLVLRVQRYVSSVYFPNGQRFVIVLRELQSRVPIRVVKDDGPSDSRASIDVELLDGSDIREDGPDTDLAGVEDEQLSQGRPVLLLGDRLEAHVLGQSCSRAHEEHHEKGDEALGHNRPR